MKFRKYFNHKNQMGICADRAITSATSVTSGAYQS